MLDPMNAMTGLQSMTVSRTRIHLSDNNRIQHFTNICPSSPTPMTVNSSSISPLPYPSFPPSPPCGFASKLPALQRQPQLVRLQTLSSSSEISPPPPPPLIADYFRPSPSLPRSLARSLARAPPDYKYELLMLLAFISSLALSVRH